MIPTAGGLINSDFIFQAVDAKVKKGETEYVSLLDRNGQQIGTSYLSLEEIDRRCAQLIPAQAGQEILVVYLEDKEGLPDAKSDDEFTIDDVQVLRHPIVAWRIEFTDMGYPYAVPVFTDPCLATVVSESFIERSDGGLVDIDGQSSTGSLDLAKSYVFNLLLSRRF